MFEVIQYNDEYGKKILTTVCNEIKDMTPSLIDGINFLVDFVSNPNNKAAGLAFPQIGVNFRAFAAKIKGEVREFINPTVISESGRVIAEEGCLSLEGVVGQVPRPKKIKVRYKTLDGQIVEETLKDWDARVFLHELDHLNGIMFITKARAIRELQTA